MIKKEPVKKVAKVEKVAKETKVEKKSEAIAEVKLEPKGRIFDGKVASTKMKDTIIVVVERFILHPIYKKPVRRTKKLAVHAPGATVKIGELVKIREIRPVSKTKHFMLLGK